MAGVWDFLTLFAVLGNDEKKRLMFFVLQVFGIFFHFSLYWAMTPNERIIFRTTKPSGLLHVSLVWLILV